LLKGFDEHPRPDGVGHPDIGLDIKVISPALFSMMVLLASTLPATEAAVCRHRRRRITLKSTANTDCASNPRTNGSG
jgi:hypothetical protein